MKQWVYIYENCDGVLTIGLTPYVEKCLSEIRERGENIIYLCPFSTPFDAVAHKHLLDDISQESVRNLIRKQKEVTEVWLNVVHVGAE
jgi:hypothetical protein